MLARHRGDDHGLPPCAAASVMYEHGLRLGREMSGVRALQRQAQCYLVAMNTLRLVQPEYAWIVQPLLHSMEVSQLSAVLMGGGGYILKLVQPRYAWVVGGGGG